MIKILFRCAALAVLLAGVSGCSFQPMYGAQNSAAVANLAFAYQKPNSRLEQIVYQALSLRFPETATAPTLAALVKLSSEKPMQSKGVFVTVDVTANVTVTIRRDGATLARITRAATTSYTVNPSQVLAREEAERYAQEQATEAATEAVRLALFAEAARLH